MFSRIIRIFNNFVIFAAMFHAVAWRIWSAWTEGNEAEMVMAGKSTNFPPVAPCAVRKSGKCAARVTFARFVTLGGGVPCGVPVP